METKVSNPNSYSTYTTALLRSKMDDASVLFNNINIDKWALTIIRDHDIPAYIPLSKLPGCSNTTLTGEIKHSSIVCSFLIKGSYREGLK